MTTTPAGWYPDPYGSPLLRWWDGSQWTDATHPREQPGGAQPEAEQIVPGGAQGGSDGGFPAQGGSDGGFPAQGGGPQWGSASQTAQLPLPGFGAPPPKQSSPWPWLLGGLAIVVVLALVSAAGVFFFRVQSSDVVARPGTETTAPQLDRTVPPQETEPPQQQLTELPRPSGGRISDPVTGLSYAFPGDPWVVPKAADINNPSNQQMPQWSSGYQALSQQNFDGKNGDWVASVFAAPLPAVFPYSGPQDLSNLTSAALVAYEPAFYSPPHARRIVSNKAIKVGGRDAWLTEFEMDFTAESRRNGWKFKTEKGAFVLVDAGAGQQPAMLYISVPDNLDQSVLQQVVDSLQVS
ncbi:DUF2510 domain-containing protein [Microtetraspora malaysiensis]|uniref:DUF2510 domain-containing protein n=1 Tax=Microtetraspora malaysiensis TaxID=161358 RepID=UPI00082A0786|nr:DUF2510 domain-containing protein [Microtetraspora malaysiensis]